jgi:hypothetical protein
MTPVPAAAEKNLSSAAVSEVGMTDEELELRLKEANEELAKFGPEKTLSNKEWRRQVRIKQEKDLLINIQKSRKSGNSTLEVKQMAQYSLMKDSQKMNPFFKYIMQLKLRSHYWG